MEELIDWADILVLDRHNAIAGLEIDPQSHRSYILSLKI
jgi:hypothetical protein